MPEFTTDESLTLSLWGGKKGWFTTLYGGSTCLLGQVGNVTLG